MYRLKSSDKQQASCKHLENCLWVTNSTPPKVASTNLSTTENPTENPTARKRSPEPQTIEVLRARSNNRCLTDCVEPAVCSSETDFFLSDLMHGPGASKHQDRFLHVDLMGENMSLVHTYLQHAESFTAPSTNWSFIQGPFQRT